MFTIAAASDKLALQTAGNIAFSTLLFGVLIGKMTLSTAIWTKLAIAAAAVVPIPGWVCTVISMKWYPLTKEKMEEPNTLE